MNNHSLRFTLPICGAIMVTGAWLATAGPPALNPPAGPVGVSGRFGTRTAISSLPFRIDQCGSYFLTDCLTGVSGQNGITITADDVTLDLNGFALIGVPGSLDAINVPATQHNIAIRNGTVRDWDTFGINAVFAQNSQLTDLRVYANGSTLFQHGMHVGAGSRVSGCTAQNNAGDGITGQGTIEHCSAARNGGHGILGQGYSTIYGCAAKGNKFGITASNSSTVTGCIAEGNSFDGIQVTNGSSIIGCTANNNGRDGLKTATSSLVRNCTSRRNTRHGIHVTASCSVLDNLSKFNTGDGIHFTGDGCVVMNNNCTGNSSGIYNKFGHDGRIEGNNLTENGRGLFLDTFGTGNIIIKNTASGNTTANYDIVAGNSFGPIITGGGDLSGIAGADHPWANFEY